MTPASAVRVLRSQRPPRGMSPRSSWSMAARIALSLRARSASRSRPISILVPVEFGAASGGVDVGQYQFGAGKLAVQTVAFGLLAAA